MNESIDVLAVLREYRELRANTQGAVMGEFDGSLARIDAAINAMAELIAYVRQAQAALSQHKTYPADVALAMDALGRGLARVGAAS